MSPFTSPSRVNPGDPGASTQFDIHADDLQWLYDNLGGTGTLTNQTGVQQLAGTVVIFDPNNDASFNTTTLQGDRRIAGVLLEDCNAGDTKKVSQAGKGTVLVQGNVTRGQWLIASSTAGRAVAFGYTKPQGAIGIALTSYSGGGAGSVVALLAVELYLGASKGKGYCMGGNGPVNNGQILNFISEVTTSTASANLSQARYWSAGISGITSGYVVGGYTTTYVATADKTPFATDTTAAQSSANISAARYILCGVNGPAAGYALGGQVGSVVATADKLTFSNDTTAAQASANLSAARGGAAGVSSSTSGYALGGTTGAVSAIADKLNFSNDTTAAQASANLSQARQYGCPVTSTAAGYVLGGDTGSKVATGDKLTYSNDTTAAASSSNLSQAWAGACGVNGSLASYALGGVTSSSVSTADKLVFATDTTTAYPSANLALAVSYPGNISTVNY